MRARVLVGLAAVSLAGAACELITHAGDFEVDTTQPFSGLCNECDVAGRDLRRVPCPSAGAAPDDGLEHVYAARTLHFGKPEHWKGPNAAAFKLGFDRDCSERPDGGQPVLCRARAVEGPNAVPWAPLPHGIDNSLTQRIFTPLYETAARFGMEFDIDQAYSESQDNGRNGLLVVVEDWNGTPDDPNVLLSVSSTPGVSDGNGPPRWDGTDRWDRYTEEDGLDTRYWKITRTEAYVSGGVLVADYRARGDVSIRFGTPEGSFRLIVHDVFLSGSLGPDRIEFFTMSALADLSSVVESVPEVAKVLSACNAAAEAYLNGTLVDLLVGAADMPSTPLATPDQLCDAISFSWAFDAEKALLGGFKADSTASDAGCL